MLGWITIFIVEETTDFDLFPWPTPWSQSCGWWHLAKCLERSGGKNMDNTPKPKHLQKICLEPEPSPVICPCVILEILHYRGFGHFWCQTFPKQRLFGTITEPMQFPPDPTCGAVDTRVGTRSPEAVASIRPSLHLRTSAIISSLDYYSAWSTWSSHDHHDIFLIYDI